MSNLEAVQRYQAKHPERIRVQQAAQRSVQKTKGWPNRKQWLANHPEARLVNSARTSAWAKGLAFNLKRRDISIPTHCPVLGIPLFFTVGKRTPNTPSIDRIDCSKGYTTDNVVIVSWRANDLKSNMTGKELACLAAFYGPRLCASI